MPISGPWITQAEIDLAGKAAATAWYSGAGSFIREFEKAFAARVGRKHAIAVSCGTAAVHLAYLALGLGPGDEAIMPDATWIATSAPLSYVGATPVFADIERSNWCIDPDSVERRITPRTRAVVAVNLYGGMPDYERLGDICRAQGITLVEDAAESVGSLHRGRPAGSFGTISIFSFHGSKTMTTGEGGMLLTDDDAIYDRAMFLRDHGLSTGPRMYWNLEIAHKYKMSDLQAAVGIAQLQRLDALVEKKRALYGWYREALADRPELMWNPEPPQDRNAFWLVTMIPPRVPGNDKDELIAGLMSNGIGCRPFFYPLSSMPAYAGHPDASRGRELNPVSYELSDTGVCLPSALRLEREDVEKVAGILRRLLHR